MNEEKHRLMKVDRQR